MDDYYISSLYKIKLFICGIKIQKYNHDIQIEF